MSELADKLTKDLPPKRPAGQPKRLDTVDDDDQKAVINLHVEGGYGAKEIADILTDRDFPIGADSVRTWLRSKGVWVES